MIKEIFITLLPSIVLLTAILLFGLIIGSIKVWEGFKSIFLGFCAVVPALITIHLLNLYIGFLIRSDLSIPLILLISALNEEVYKYIFISISYKKGVRYVKGFLIAGGFALGETLYLTLGEYEAAFYRGVITMPLHMVTTLFLTLYYKKKRPLFLVGALLIHTLFNLIIR